MKRILVALSRSTKAQRVLERFVEMIQSLMGIGSGGVPESSGEHVLVDLLINRSRALHRPLCVLDVGANRGQFLSMIVNGLGDVPFHVHAIEPSASAFRALAAEHSDSSRVTLNQLGLGKEEGTLALYSNAEGSGIASLYPRRLDHFGIDFSLTESVSIGTLDTYCERHALRVIDLLKLDVEGHELDVLRGASQLLKDGVIDTITFEFGGCNIDSRTYFQDFFYFFKSYGSFRLFRITPSGFLAPLDEYREVYEQFRTTNFLVRRIDT